MLCLVHIALLTHRDYLSSRSRICFDALLAMSSDSAFMHCLKRGCPKHRHDTRHNLQQYRHTDHLMTRLVSKRLITATCYSAQAMFLGQVWAESIATRSTVDRKIRHSCVPLSRWREKGVRNYDICRPTTGHGARKVERCGRVKMRSLSPSKRMPQMYPR